MISRLKPDFREIRDERREMRGLFCAQTIENLPLFDCYLSKAKLNNKTYKTQHQL